jgi:uncharacterized protein YbbK (DUF523 family)
MYLISACLCGVNCKYNGGNNLNSKAMKLFEEGKAVLVCPEQLGEQTTPRLAHEITGGTGRDVLEGKARVIDKATGDDKTESFILGAQRTLAIAKSLGITKAILKQRSPSCGRGQIYDGNFKGQVIEGNGVTSELLIQNGIEVITEEDL